MFKLKIIYKKTYYIFPFNIPVSVMRDKMDKMPT